MYDKIKNKQIVLIFKIFYGNYLSNFVFCSFEKKTWSGKKSVLFHVFFIIENDTTEVFVAETVP